MTVGDASVCREGCGPNRGAAGGGRATSWPRPGIPTPVSVRAEVLHSFPAGLAIRLFRGGSACCDVVVGVAGRGRAWQYRGHTLQGR